MLSTQIIRNGLNNFVFEKENHIFVSKLKVNRILVYNVKKKNIFEISLVLKRDYIGLGLGTKMLKGLKNFCLKKFYSFKVKNNKNSISCFKQSQFCRDKF